MKRRLRRGHSRDLLSSHDLHCSTMKHTQKRCLTPTSVTARCNGSHVLQTRSRNILGPSGKNQPRRQNDVCGVRMAVPPTIVIHRQEMASYFGLFVDDLIQDFLRMDCCCKMTDKYLLAMTFVYFKRACFSLAEYTRENFFTALYLANTMEEDEEEIRYEIFPWALGKNWRKRFPHFLKQRDKLWVRIEFRAAVSRRCCEEVMAIVPSHFVWQRERSELHSGAQRQYSGGGSSMCFPRGPSASPVSCVLCNRITRLDQNLGSYSAPPTADSTYPHPFTFSLPLEKTPVRATASCRKVTETKSHKQHSSCCASRYH
ncbi:speedy protein A [Solea solea]|uniref:speedy protein A n=1 Tax=Solea solea TaxID=90069 RepID=UPI00272D6DF7|nr:speedy protein A [Solea solea]